MLISVRSFNVYNIEEPFQLNLNWFFFLVLNSLIACDDYETSENRSWTCITV